MLILLEVTPCTQLRPYLRPASTCNHPSTYSHPPLQRSLPVPISLPAPCTHPPFSHSNHPYLQPSLPGTPEGTHISFADFHPVALVARRTWELVLEACPDADMLLSGPGTPHYLNDHSPHPGGTGGMNLDHSEPLIRPPAHPPLTSSFKPA